MKAVIFDMDGVLIDSEPLHVLADQMVFQKLGIELPPGYLDKFAGATDLAMWKEAVSEFNIEKGLDEIVNLQLSIKLKLLKQGTHTPIEGILDLLEELTSHDIRIGVASSSSTMFIKEVLKKLKLDSFIFAWVSGENIEKSKPFPDIFLKCAELLKVHARDCVVIEDSKLGISAAKQAGMKSVGFKNANSGNQDLKKADRIVEKISDITFTNLGALFEIPVNPNKV